MNLRIEAVTFDSQDPVPLARFWQQLLDWRLSEEDGDEILVSAPNGEAGGVPSLLFLRVPEGKAVKNRVHLDLRPDDQDVAVRRAEELGAKRIDVGQTDEATWVVLADPQGNEFCILRTLRPDERGNN